MNDLMDQELFKQLRFKLINNNIYFSVLQETSFEDGTVIAKPGADLIRSGVLFNVSSDTFRFIIVYRSKAEEDDWNGEEDEDFGLIRVDIQTLIDKMKKKEIAAYYINKRIPDAEIKRLLEIQMEGTEDGVQSRTV